MNKLGLKEPGFENRRTVSKKAREPQKLSRFQKFALVNVSQSRTVKQAFKTVRKPSTLVKKSHVDNRFEFEQSVQVSCEFKQNEGMTLSLKLALLF